MTVKDKKRQRGMKERRWGGGKGSKEGETEGGREGNDASCIRATRGPRPGRGRRGVAGCGHSGRWCPQPAALHSLDLQRCRLRGRRTKPAATGCWPRPIQPCWLRVRRGAAPSSGRILHPPPRATSMTSVFRCLIDWAADSDPTPWVKPPPRGPYGTTPSIWCYLTALGSC